MKRTYTFSYLNKLHTAHILPHFKKDGWHFEINMVQYDRFYLQWGAMGRYELTPNSPHIPDDIVYFIGDIIEQNLKVKL